MRKPTSSIPDPGFRSGWLLSLMVGFLSLGGFGGPRKVAAQETEGSAAAVAGATALGLYSGSALGLTGSLLPCSQRVGGLGCTRLFAVVGGLVGGASGAVVGANDTDRAWNHARNAGIGALAGGITGALLKDLVRHYGWLDAGAGVMLGAAIGAAPAGAGIGFASGAVVGVVLWQLVPTVEVADAVGLGLGGLALGGLGSWVASAVRSAEETPRLEVMLPLSVLFSSRGGGG
jgi:hypothetical protein